MQCIAFSFYRTRNAGFLRFPDCKVTPVPI